jgi:regulator of sigma E protease
MHILQVALEFSIVLGIMVLIHELGHFLVAKACGVRIEAFSIGFGPRLFGIRYKGTDYKLCALPLGGYVKMAGELPGSESVDVLGVDLNPAEGDFNGRPRWQRILIALAGPVSNFILSFFLLFLVAHFHHEIDQYLAGPAIVDYVPLNTPAARDGLATGDTLTSFNNIANPTWDRVLEETAFNLNRSVPFTFTHNGQPHASNLQLTVQDDGDFSPDSLASIGLIPRMQPGPIGIETVSSGTPADAAGLKPGDLIQRIDNLEPHSVQTLHAFLKDRNGAPATVAITRNGQPLTFNLTPEHVQLDAHTSQFQIGFLPQPAPVTVERLPFAAAAADSYKENKKGSKLILRVLQGLFTRHVSVKQMSGPVGIAQDIDLATRLGIWPLLNLMSVISLNLGIFNLLPIPILDGGMILFLLIESALRRDVHIAIKERVYQVAFVCIILFAFFVLFNDITKLHIGR